MIATMEKIERREEFLSEINRAFKAHADHIVGVLTEHYDDKIKLVVEQFDGLNNAIDGVRQEVAVCNSKIDSLIVDVVMIKNDLKAKADAKDVIILDRRLCALEAKH